MDGTRFMLATLAAACVTTPASATESPGCAALAARPLVMTVGDKRPFDALAECLPRVRVAYQNDFVPSRGAFNVLVFKPYVENDVYDEKGAVKTARVTWRAAIVGEDGSLLQGIEPAEAWPIAARQGANGIPGTDFKYDESKEEKTSIALDAKVFQSDHLLTWMWRPVRIYLIGTTGADGKEGARPAFIGSFDTRIANKPLAALLAVLGCVLAYLVAAVATFSVHRAFRVWDRFGNSRGTITVPPADASTSGATPPASPTGPHDKGHGFLVGTNYQSVWKHIVNPVVLTAGSNGVGNATNLQILFFSLIVFGVMSYIWMMTGHLTGLSSTVVLLMGISGISATAATGADNSKNRLSFDNWAWLVNRGWLPPGGLAEVNVAKWKDIFTTNGAFDVYRFQMVCFSVVVGLSLIGVGTQATDLSTFEVPSALLGILGLSQAVYVAGKLVAQPSIAELDEQIGKLSGLEQHLRELDAAARAQSAGVTVLAWSVDAKLGEAQKARVDYLEEWDKTRTMFESTLGRLVPKGAESKRPPFDLSDVLLNRLPRVIAGQPYQQQLTLVGAPTPGPYEWRLDPGNSPPVLKLEDSRTAVAGLTMAAGSLSPGDYRFAIRVRDTVTNQSITKDFLLSV